MDELSEAQNAADILLAYLENHGHVDDVSTIEDLSKYSNNFQLWLALCAWKDLYS